MIHSGCGAPVRLRSMRKLSAVKRSGGRGGISAAGAAAGWGSDSGADDIAADPEPTTRYSGTISAEAERDTGIRCCSSSCGVIVLLLYDYCRGLLQ